MRYSKYDMLENGSDFVSLSFRIHSLMRSISRLSGAQLVRINRWSFANLKNLLYETK